MSAEAAQEASYTEDFDYREGSPHLKHWTLYDRLVGILRETIESLGSERSESVRILDVGAGEGSFTEPMLAMGASVTAVEMSTSSVARLSSMFAKNPQFSVVHDPDGSLSTLEGQQFDVILYASVLHHIPDYLTAIDVAVGDYLRSGGAFVSFQDPLWYPTQPKTTKWLADASYLSWRITQGNLLQGVKTRIRRTRGVYDENNPSDMTEYHVVREGVDQRAIESRLSALFDRVSIEPYWSTQSGAWQWIGERLGVKNTFLVVATGYRGDSA